MRKFLVICLFQFMACGFILAQDIKNNPGSNHANKFEQLGTILPTPNEYRTASGAPGRNTGNNVPITILKQNWMKKHSILQDSETITYYNNSPDVLSYIWLQLDENEHSAIKNAGYQNS